MGLKVSIEEENMWHQKSRPEEAEADFLNILREYRQGWKFISCCHGQESGQQASWLLIGSARVNSQSEVRTAS